MTDKKPLKILFIAEEGSSPSAVYRAKLPAKYLRSQGYDAKYMSVLAEAPGQRLYGVGKGGLFDPDIIVTRQIADHKNRAMDMADRIMDARGKGQRIFYDLDDDMWNIPEWNPAYHTESPVKRRRVENNILSCDGVIASTPGLAASVRLNLPSTNVTVCRSGIDTNSFHLHPPHRPIRVGWLGETRFRGEDLRHNAEGIFSALDKTTTSYQFWQLGYLRGSPDVREFIGEWATGVEIVRRPWVNYERLSESLSQVDIGIIPEKPHRFGHSRSFTTGLAFAASGIPFVATGNAEYEYLAEEYGVGWIAHPLNGDWGMLGAMVDTGTTQGEAQRKVIEECWDYKVTGKQWEDLLCSM